MKLKKEMAGVVSGGGGRREYGEAVSQVYPQHYNNMNYSDHHPNMNYVAIPRAAEYRYDVYENVGTQYINGIINQVGIAKGHGNGATVYGSFYVR